MKLRAAWLAAVWSLLGAAACRAAGTAPSEPAFELALEFEGEESVDQARLSEIVWRELARLELTRPDKAAVDDAAFALELFYRARGHAEVHVDYDFDPALEGTPRARFRISEGPVVRVRELVLEGPSTLAPASVRALLGPAASGGIYDEERLAAGLEAVRELYLERGYLRFALEEPAVEFDAQRTSVALHIVLREGPVFLVQQVDIRGGVAELAERERELARQHQGSIYQPVLRPEIEHVLIEAYRRRGYHDVAVKVEAEFDEASGAVRVDVRVTPGELVRLAHFKFAGNVRTRDAAILGFMGIERGEPYDSERVRAAFRELYATGLFESVSLEVEGQGPERTLAVTVVEARSVQIRMEPGYGSYEGPRVLLGVEENNFQGRGQVLALEGTASLRAKSARISWIDRDFLGSAFTSETSFFVEDREEPAFEFVRRGFAFFLRRRLDEDWSSTLGYEYRPTNVNEDGSSPPLSLDSDPDSDSAVAALSAAVALDDRDSPLLPTRGRHGRARLEWAEKGLGSDTEFVRAQLEYTHLLRFGDENVLAASGSTGLIAPLGVTGEIPIPERFFNGGESSVRSFREDELLPENDSRLGGEAATTLNLELRRTLTGNLSGALFVDAGNVTLDVGNYLEFAGFRTGVGLGLRYLLPIGPVRLDFGVNPAPRGEEDEFVLHFSVGFPF